MGSDIYAKLIDTEEFISKLVMVASSQDPANGEECEAFFETEIYPYEEKMDMGAGIWAVGFIDISNYLRQNLPSDVLAKFKLFSSLVLPRILADVRVEKYQSELDAIELAGWILLREEVRIAKEASTFVSFLQTNKEALAAGFQPRGEYEGYEDFLLYLERWLDLVDTAIEKDCGVLIYELT